MKKQSLLVTQVNSLLFVENSTIIAEISYFFTNFRKIKKYKSSESSITISGMLIKIFFEREYNLEH